LVKLHNNNPDNFGVPFYICKAASVGFTCDCGVDFGILGSHTYCL